MLRFKPTEHLTGVTIQGDLQDFYELTESIYRITGIVDDPTSAYYGVRNTLLAICYDIRHAYMGDHDIFTVENGMNQEIMRWHKMITPTNNVYYSGNVLFPLAIFAAVSMQQAFPSARKFYESKNMEEGEHLPPYSDYVHDKAYLNQFAAGVWQALGEVIGGLELEKIIRSWENSYDSYACYATQYIDKCNIELLKAPLEKRKDKLRNIAKRLVKAPQAYYTLLRDLHAAAKEYNTDIYSLHDSRLEYPEEIEW